jgi:hypothetical protein
MVEFGTLKRAAPRSSLGKGGQSRHTSQPYRLQLSNVVRTKTPRIEVVVHNSVQIRTVYITHYGCLYWFDNGSAPTVVISATTSVSDQ